MGDMVYSDVDVWGYTAIFMDGGSAFLVVGCFRWCHFSIFSQECCVVVFIGCPSLSLFGYCIDSVECVYAEVCAVCFSSDCCAAVIACLGEIVVNFKYRAGGVLWCGADIDTESHDLLWVVR